MKKVPMELSQVLAAFLAIKRMEKEKVGIKWAYAVSKNKAKLQPEIDGIANAEKGFIVAEKKRVQYCEANALKDKDGKPVIENGEYKGIDIKDPKFVEIIENSKKLGEERLEFLKNSTEVELHIVDFKDVPEQISQADLESLMPMIKEPE